MLAEITRGMGGIDMPPGYPIHSRGSGYGGHVP